MFKFLFINTNSYVYILIYIIIYGGPIAGVKRPLQTALESIRPAPASHPAHALGSAAAERVPVAKATPPLPPETPRRGPPQAELHFDQTPAFDLAAPEPSPEYEFDQSAPHDWEA